MSFRAVASLVLGSVVIAGAAASALAMSVSAEPPGVTVPDVLGLPAIKAAYRIDFAHLKPVCRDAQRRGTVVEQRPTAGADVPRGSVVTIISGDGDCPAVKLQPITPSTPTPTGLAPALRTHTPKVIVTPSTNLTTGEMVEVSVTGFGMEGKFWITECASATDATTSGCGTAFGLFGMTKATGSGSYELPVRSTARSGPYTTSSTASCTDQCVIVATAGHGFGYAYAPVTFAGG